MIFIILHVRVRVSEILCIIPKVEHFHDENYSAISVQKHVEDSYYYSKRL